MGEKRISVPGGGLVVRSYIRTYTWPQDGCVSFCTSHACGHSSIEYACARIYLHWRRRDGFVHTGREIKTPKFPKKSGIPPLLSHPFCFPHTSPSFAFICHNLHFRRDKYGENEVEGSNREVGWKGRRNRPPSLGLLGFAGRG